MNRSIIFVTLLCLLFASAFTAYSQKNMSEEAASAMTYLNKKGEVYFTFNIKSKAEIKTLTKIISIDNVSNRQQTTNNKRQTTNDKQQYTVFAYANKKEFQRFESLGYDYHVLPHPGDLLQNPKMFETYNKNIMAWDAFPTYTAYETMMYQFATDYPEICQIVNIGSTVQGRKLLFAKISRNVNTLENEPRFMYTSSMHGDEATGYVLMLRLIDYLLTGYGSDPEVDNLVNNMEIWINPLANPDGTYAGGNSTVNGATRENANNVDLNRNYPNSVGGDHPDGSQWQTETINMMNFADSIHFSVIGNFHGGAEVVNYPWDTWTSANTHADDNWWQYVAHEYADTAHVYSPGYMTDVSSDGITNGGDWYLVYGSRQDYTTYYKHSRECTFEISSTKLVNAAELPTYWNYNYRSLLNYMEQTLYGVRGQITDSLTGAPLKGRVFIATHDKDSSDVYSELPGGYYYRPIYQGSYNITYSASGYKSKTITNVTIANHDTTILNVQLAQDFPTAAFSSTDSLFCTSPATVQFINQSDGGASYFWDFGDGSTSTDYSPSHAYAIDGTYTVTLIVFGIHLGNDTIIKPAYISIGAANPCQYNMPLSGSANYTVCSGILFDSGGNSNYPNNSNSVVTIAPPGAASVTLTFSSFNFELDYDFLNIFDGSDIASPLIGSYTGTNLPNGGTITTTGSTVTIQQYSDQNTTGSGFKLSWQCNYATSPPVADFEANVTTGCSGEIQFSDLSTNGPVTWLWDFGDGTISPDQNPLHTYTADGVYTVSLLVSNSYGSDGMIKNDYITIGMPVAPTAIPDERCGVGSVNLSASGAGILNWYTDSAGGAALYAGNTYVTPLLDSTQTFYVGSEIQADSQFVGAIYNPADGSIFNNNTKHYLVFDCFSECKLVSVFVNAQNAGNRVIELRNSANALLQSVTVAVPAGSSRVTLNFDLPVGTDLRLVGPSAPGLFRSSQNVAYPYDLPGFVRIKTSSATTSPNSYYYYFYNWEVRGPSCFSPRTPVTATINNLVPEIGADRHICQGELVTLTPGAGYSQYNWSTGDSIPQITVSANGNYSVTVTDINGCTGADTVSVTVHSLPVVWLGNDTTICGTPIDLDAGPGYYSYEWSTLEIGQQITVSDPGTYSVTISDAYNCTASDEIIIAADQFPVAGFAYSANQGTLTFTNISTNADSYYWDFGDTFDDFVANPVHTYTNSGNYFIMLIATNVCSSDTFGIVVNVIISDISENEALWNVDISPNPAKHSFNLSYSNPYPGSVSIELTDIVGKAIWKQQYNSAGAFSNTFNVSGLSQGMYLLRLANGGREIVKKLIIE